MVDAGLETAYASLLRWVADEGCRGYDPYDGLNTRYRLLRSTRAIRIGMTYLNKFSPVNLRPMLGIPKTIGNHGTGLIVRALVRHPAPGVELPLQPLLDHLMSVSLYEKYGYHCWNGLPFALQMRHLYQSPDTPGVIGTEACGGALLDYYLATGDERYREVVLSTRRFFLEQLLTRYEGATFFRYKPTTPHHQCTYNASVVAAGYVARVNRELGLTDGWTELAEVYDFLVQRQRPDGSWYYKVDLRNGREKPQVDFHQGFMLDGLMDYLEAVGEAPAVEESFRRGIEFYRNSQFDSEGRGLYRYPRRWPVNIHNQAQGILTFSRAARFDPAHHDFARTIATWTVRHMQSPRGHFYYVQYPWLTNRIPYMRWSDGAMARALAEHLHPAATPAALAAQEG